MNQKVLPRPGSLIAPMLPPISSTSSFEMASPSPVPPKLRVVDTSAWWKGSKSSSICEASIPMPVSVTSTRSNASRPADPSAESSTATFPERVNLSAFDKRFVSTWRKRGGADLLHRVRHVVRHVT